MIGSAVGVMKPALIDYPRFNRLYNLILQSQELTRSRGEPHCVAIEGDTGVGKSRLIEEFVLGSLSTGSNRPSALYVNTPEIRAEGAIATAILEQLGDPFPSKGPHVWAQKYRIKKLMRDLEVDTVCFDDFHHLWDRKRGEALYELADYIKTLIKESNKTLVVVGIVGEVGRILEENDQLKRLFAPIETLGPLNPKTEFPTFIALAEEQLGMELHTEYSKVQLLNKLYYATTGVAAYIFRLLDWSKVAAQDEQSNVILTKHLNAGYEKIKHNIGRENPFI